MHDDFYQMYLEELKNVTPCSHEEQKKMLEQLQKGDGSVKKMLIEGHLHQVLEYAKFYEGKGLPLIDLVQEANTALVLFLEQYTGQPFDESLEKQVKQALEWAVSEQQEAKQTGEELAARMNVLQDISGMLAKQLGREPSLEELVQTTKWTKEEIEAVMKMILETVNSELSEEAEG